MGSPVARLPPHRARVLEPSVSWAPPASFPHALWLALTNSSLPHMLESLAKPPSQSFPPLASLLPWAPGMGQECLGPPTGLSLYHAHSAGSFVLCCSSAAAGQKVLFEGDSSSHAGLCPSPLPPWWDLGLALPCPTPPVGSQSPFPSGLGPVVRADAPQATALFALLGYVGQPGVRHLPDLLSFLLKAAQLLLGHLSIFIFAQTPASSLDTPQHPLNHQIISPMN